MPPASPILITGATGFVGAAVVRCLLARGFPVRTMVRPKADLRNLAGLDVETVHGDLLDTASLTAACRGIGGLFHVAADYRLWVPKPAPMFAANVDGSVNIIRAAAEAGAERIVYTSSVAVLKTFGDGRLSDEDIPVTLNDMVGPYKQSKFLAEEKVRALVENEKAPVVIVNPSTPIGPRDIKPTPTGQVVLDAARGRLPAYVDTGLNVAHVDDVAEGHLLAWEKGQTGRRYILGGENLALKDILSIAAQAGGRTAPKISLPHGAVMPIAWAAEAWCKTFGGTPMATIDGVKMARKKMYFSCERAKNELGYQHRPAREAIQDAVNWFRSEGYC